MISYAARMRRHQADLADYQRRMDNSGLGEADRERYITGTVDPRAAALVWDEQIIPAAEAAGDLPQAPIEPLSPREQAQQAARTEVYRALAADPQYDISAQESDETRTARTARIAELTEQLLPGFEAAEARALQAEVEAAGCVQSETPGEVPAADEFDMDL